MLKYTNYSSKPTNKEISLNYESWEFLNQLEKQKEYNTKIQEYIENIEGNFNQIVLIGIGGSMLGPRCIAETLVSENKKYELYYVDNLDTYEINKIEDKLNWQETLFITISKSGNTPETMGAFYYFKEQAEFHDVDLSFNFLFICDEGENNLRSEADKINSICFDIPKNLGGRYSVLSNVGLVFSALLGLDINKMIEGGIKAKNNFLDNINDKSSNHAFTIASTIFDAYENGQQILTLFPYFKRGEFLGKWFVQLFAESLGKVRESDQKIISPTPIFAIGATDQHSILQLFKEGANDKIYLFLELEESGFGEKILMFPKIENEKLEYLSSHRISNVLNTQLQATIDSLLESNRNVSKLTLSKIDEETLGYLFVFFEIICATLGDAFEINTFNQPGVERSKILTKEYLINQRNDA
jgi:glucose-6-phosphate isomerase